MAGEPGEGPASDAPIPPKTRAFLRRNLPTLVGLLIALVAVGVYFFYVLRPEVAKLPKAVARLSSIVGGVKVKFAGQTNWVNGKEKQVLRTGDIVKTDQKAAAEITFFSGNVVKVRPDSVVLISEGEAAVAEEATAWHVQSGQVNFELKQATDIVTPTARTRASANATGNIDVGEEGNTGVKIFQGSAEVSTTLGQTVSLANNEAVLVDAKGKAGPKIELPPTPTLVAPPGQAEIPFVKAPETTVLLTWGTVKGAATYHVAMDYNVVQANLLLSAALDNPNVTGSEQGLTGLDPGKYYWRVAGVSKEGLEGDFSRVAFFSVVKPPEPTPVPSGGPRLVVQAADLESVLEVRGQADPGSVVTVDGHEVKVHSDGSFTEHVRKTGQNFIVVRATSADGQVSEEKRPVSNR